MGNIIEVKTPDLSGVSDVPVTEVFVSPGLEVEQGDNLIAIETEKTIIDIAAPVSGIVKEVISFAGDRVAEDQVLITIESDEAVTSENDSPVSGGIDKDLSTQVVVIGSGPGGYSAAFRAADLGKEVVLIERYTTLGGVCLNVGCIPSKSLLHAAKVISETKEMAQLGLKYTGLEIDVQAMRNWKNKVINQLTSGLQNLAKKRNVKIVSGEAAFISSTQLKLKSPDGNSYKIDFENAVIAAGSEAIEIPDFPHEDIRMLTSTEALEINNIPDRLLVVGGGIIGLEMATVYHELGSKVTVVEFLDSLIPGADADLVKPLHQRIQHMYENIYLGTKVSSIESTLNGMYVRYEGDIAQNKDVFDQVLIAVGRRPNGNMIDADKAGVKVDDQGFIPTDNKMCTNVKNIFAIGDIVGQPMLAHKAAHEGKVAAEVIAGMDSKFDDSLIPSVAYTDPEIAWVGLTESNAKQLNVNYETAHFPWAASGRALSIDRKEGLTKILYDSKTNKIIGAGIVGSNAGELISEVALAIKVGATVNDIAELIHPHPTLSETIGFSAEVANKTIVDMYMK
ncbi:MAG: dihydrolipoyl dehydrogenase [Gammaproteobacteria bacterium]|nr:dihydrolipoyl dehydrogenase [Gammaproteobacteria bacterium]